MDINQVLNSTTLFFSLKITQLREEMWWILSTSLTASQSSFCSWSSPWVSSSPSTSRAIKKSAVKQNCLFRLFLHALLKYPLPHSGPMYFGLWMGLCKKPQPVCQRWPGLRPSNPEFTSGPRSFGSLTVIARGQTNGFKLLRSSPENSKTSSLKTHKTWKKRFNQLK